jgi:carbamate kinase
MILTSVEHVEVGYDTDHAKPLSEVTVEEAERYMADGQFEPGTMLPKIQAGVDFLKKGGKRVIITSIDHAKDGYLGRTGTIIQ